MTDDEPPVRWRAAVPDDDDGNGDLIFTVGDFISAVAAGAFNDDDGFGECARFGEHTGIEVSDVRIYPSDLDRPSWCTHVCWYNK